MKLKINRGKKNNLKPVKKAIKTSEALENSERNYETLDDVIDKSRDLCMYFSGVENSEYFNILYDMGIRNFLMSYHYVQKKHLKVSEYVEKGVKFFIDSGAFTFMSDVEHEKWNIEEWEKYIEQYIIWAEKHKDIIFAIANLDIEYLVGGQQVQIWNEKYFEPFMLRTGIPVCFVYHDNGTSMSWEQYCQRYPYVGISWGGVDTQGNDYQYGFERLRIAEKNNAVVHGMAMTATSLLVKLPFYTVDSTTWLVGLQYGEVNYWTGSKMTRLKKDKWKGSMLQNLIDLGFDKEKLLNEDTTELIKVNVRAFIEAEKFVRERLKSLMYWKKAQTVKRESLDEVNFPDLETIKDDNFAYEDIAKEFNINPDDPYFARWAIRNATVFIHWDKCKDDEWVSSIYTEEWINGLHQQGINKIRGSLEEKLEDLKQLYTDCILGKNDRLLLHGTNFDRTVKERDEYVIDEEYDMVDVPEVEMENFFAKYLPMKAEDAESGEMPEVDSLDDEIFEENGIVPVRDEKGHFVKGQRQVLKPKKLYSEKYPKLACNNCVNAQKCPEYKEGYVCAYNKMFRRYNSRNLNDVIEAMEGITDLSLERLQRAMLTETMNGGIPDPMVSNLMNQATGLLNNVVKLHSAKSQEILRQTQIVRSDGTRETTTQVQSNPQSGGLLDKLFENMLKGQPEEQDIIDTEDEEVE